ncbi:hypothetical protein N7532_004756 [Penicillium argentinense]|uniref:Fe2OG dioxygenase domain-containing protein n=1 Tax=Penicillium argentinense TaxID=1131581 RepID=A0A9W9FQJ0_9EURO|nr:uncharacterized protein N7532_004756 [Penicillium argentinense]KAJ5104227.1 hypothetical protein N7532_004756 [Penicillium argentinense]
MAPSVALDPHVEYGRDQPTMFSAKRHIDYSPPAEILQMKDLGQNATELSSVASTVPFPLLSHEAVLQHRREIFSDDVLDNCMHHTRPGSVQIRGMAPRYASFIHEFWHSPEVLKIISDNAGVELVPAMDYEISHTNVQLGPGGLDVVRKSPIEPPMATEEAIAKFEKEKSKLRAVTDQSKPIIEWHRDSHPFVCVVMLSDARHMVGGETELKRADGSTLKVKAPQMGCAVILQGRYITHTAAPAANMPERVTIVTSFRPKNPTLLDETTNANVRNKSHLTELYYQWSTYRLDVLAQRAHIAAQSLREKYEKHIKESDSDGKKGLCRVETVNVKDLEAWAEGQIKYIEETLQEMQPLGQ